jgi:hypothetical protein
MLYLLLAAADAGTALMIPGSEPAHRRGRGARHRAPGFPRLRPSGTYPRRRAA